MADAPDVTLASDNTAVTGAGDPSPPRIGEVRGERAADAFRRYGLALVLIALIAVFSIIEPSTFLSLSNLRNLIQEQMVVFVLTLGLLFPLSAGEFDLSISATLIFAAAIVGLLITSWHWNPALAALAGCGIGAGVGLFNGVIVVKVGLNGFITTLAVMTILAAAALGISGQTVILLYTNPFSNVTVGDVAWLPVGGYYVLLLAVACWYVLERTPLGVHVRISGTAREVGRLMSLRVDRLRLGAYVVCGLAAGFSAFLLLGTVGSLDPSTSGDYLLQPYATAFLGTAAIKLGRFNAVWISVIGVTGLELMGLSSWIGELFQGGLLLIGLLIARIASRSEQVILTGGAP
jgi:ribose transport system permease protein